MAHDHLQRAVVTVAQPVEKPLEDVVNSARAFRLCSECTNRLHIIGVSVSETKPETSTATTIVTANSCSNRPSNPLMNKTGMKTAESDSVMEMIVKPISFEPLSAASIGGSPFSMWRTIFSSMTMASSTTKPTHKRQRHERKIVEAVTEQRHHRERADDGHRQREAGNERRRKIPQENKNDHDDEAHGQEQRVFHVRHRFADGLANGQRARPDSPTPESASRNCGSNFLMLSTTSTVFAPGWRWTASTTARVLLYHAAALVVLHAVEHVAQLLQPHRIAVAIRDNHRTEMPPRR